VIEELHTYVERNQVLIPNYGERYRDGKDRFWFCRVGGEPSGEQADGEAATDGMEPARSASAPADPNQGARLRVGEYLPPLISGVPATVEVAIKKAA